MEHNRNDGHNPRLQVHIQPNIGLDNDVHHSVVEIRNISLADEAMLTAKTRSSYWMVRGAGFFELRTFFETQPLLLNNIYDEIAERVQMLGDFAIGSHAELSHHTRLEERPGDVPDILHLLADHESFIRFFREDARKCTEEYEDEGTFELLVSRMRPHKKMAWMLRSILRQNLFTAKAKKDCNIGGNDEQ